MNEQQHDEARSAGQADDSTATGGSAIHATHGVLHDAIAATEMVGSELVGGVSHLASDIVHGVGDVGNTAVTTLTHLLVDVVGGVRQVMGAAVGRHTDGHPGERADISDVPPHTGRSPHQSASQPPG